MNDDRIDELFSSVRRADPLTATPSAVRARGTQLHRRRVGGAVGGAVVGVAAITLVATSVFAPTPTHVVPGHALSYASPVVGTHCHRRAGHPYADGVRPASPSSSPSGSVSTPAPAARLTVDQLVTQIAECPGGGCLVVRSFVASQPDLRFTLVQLPAPKGTVEVPLRVALFNTKTERLTYSSPVLTGVPVTETNGRAAQDAIGHIAFTLLVGAHASNLYVLDPADGKNVTWFGIPSPPEVGQPLNYSGDTPGTHAEDLDGDGIFEVVLPQNDFNPDYASGNTTVFRYGWKASARRYASIGCTYFPSGSTKGTDYGSGASQCAAG